MRGRFFVAGTLSMAAFVSVGAGSCGTSDLGCALTGHELGEIITKDHEGETAYQILSGVAEIGAENECESMVHTLVDHPRHNVKFTVTDAAKQQTTTAQGTTVLYPPHPLDLNRLIACAKWVHGTRTEDPVGWALADLCDDSQVPPPVQ